VTALLDVPAVVDAAGPDLANVENGSGSTVVEVGTGSTVAVMTDSEVEELRAVVVDSGATEAAVWINAPPESGEGAGAEASGSALNVETGTGVAVVAATTTLEESDKPEPDTKDALVVRSSIVDGEQLLGPEDHPIRRLATSDA
jgi:hypothetical protein